MSMNSDPESFWEQIFSEDHAAIHAAWESLDDIERGSVRDLLATIVSDGDRIEAQRLAARFALNIVDGGNSAVRAAGSLSFVGVPEGALEFAQHLAHDTGLRLKYASGQLIASMKKDGTLVTASDIEADQRLGAEIAARYPAHGVLSEEGEKVFHGQEWCWIVDPIDGTTNFTWGFPGWGVLVGLLYQGYPVLGVAEFPPIGQQLYAVRGQGAWRKTEIGYGDGPIHTAADRILTETQLFVIGTRSLKQGKPNLPCKLRLPGSSGLDFAMLACGACVGAYDASVHVWDVAALWPIIEEAGGHVVTNHPGGVFPLQAGVDYSSVVFAALGAGSAELLAASLTALSDRFVLP